MTSTRSLSPAATRHPVRRLAAVLGLHLAPASDPVTPAPHTHLPVVGRDDLTTRLARLHDEHVERANAAVAEDRDDLLQELSDSYVEEATALMTAAGMPPARAAEHLAA